MTARYVIYYFISNQYRHKRLWYGHQRQSTLVVKPLLHNHLSGKPPKEAYNYQTAVDMLNDLQGNILPNMSVAVHQTARFCNKSILSHEKAIRRLRR